MWEALWVTDLAGGEEMAQHGVGTGPGGMSAPLREGALPGPEQPRARCVTAPTEGEAGREPCWLYRAGPAIPADRAWLPCLLEPGKAGCRAGCCQGRAHTWAVLLSQPGTHLGNAGGHTWAALSGPGPHLGSIAVPLGSD